MKLCIINAGMPNHDDKLSIIYRIVKETLDELSVEVSVINLFLAGVGFYDGLPSEAVSGIFSEIKSCDGLIIMTPGSMGGVSGLTQSFLEHLRVDSNKDALKAKRVMHIAASSDGSEAYACEHISRVLSLCKAFDCARAAIGSGYDNELKTDGEFKQAIENMTEDFFRLVRRGGKQFVPGYMPPDGQKLSEQDVSEQKKNDASEKEPEFEPFIAQTVQKLQTSDFSKLSEKDENSIKEISDYLSKKMTAKAQTSDIVSKPAGAEQNKAISCLKATKSLSDNFKSRFSGGLNAVFQLNITGGEEFDLYINVVNSECSFTEGSHDNPDILIYADSGVWKDILDGKLTCQKAFMIGKIKVRGNFMHLSKFDQIFGNTDNK